MALNRREKALLSLPVVLGGVMSFYNWVHEPLFQRRGDAEDRSRQVQAELKKEQAKLIKEGDIDARTRAVASREKTIDGWVPGKNSAAQFIWYLSQAEQHSGARVRGVMLSGLEQVTPQSEPIAALGKAPATKQPQTAAARQNQSAGAEQERAAEAQVSGKSQASEKAQTSEKAQAPAKTQAPAKPQASAANESGIQTTLTVVRLDLKVDGRFVEHLLFNQAIEQMPLFLNTDAMTLSRVQQSPLDRVGEFLQQGNLEDAEAILTASPIVEGQYHINLYFKGAKAGPATSTMQFSDDTGRMDPFAMEGVSEFVQSVVEYYSNPETQKGTNPDGTVHSNRDGSGNGGQLG